MNLKLLFPFFLGALLVLQPGFNKHIMTERGLGFAIVMNGFVLFVLTSSFLILLLALGDRLPEVFRIRHSSAMHWWYIIPGLCGFSLVVCVPLVLASVGAVSTVVGMLSGQLLTSMLWDAWVEGRSTSLLRILGVLLALGGAFLTQMSRHQK